jgi:hypothetical protein
MKFITCSLAFTAGHGGWACRAGSGSLKSNAVVAPRLIIETALRFGLKFPTITTVEIDRRSRFAR